MNNPLISDDVYQNLPPILKKLTDNFERREKDIVLLSSLGALSSSLPNVYGMYDGKIVFSNLYIMIIAPPASGKGVMTFARDLLKPIHDKVYGESKTEIEECHEVGKQNKKKRKKPAAALEGSCPPIVTKIIPGNISSAEMYPTIKNAHYGGIIIESEADTLSLMLNQDWGNFSDVLRKAFHHEPISISRKMENLYMEIDAPQLSLVVSGTPDQLQPLVKSKDNGLFSRMIFYTFEEVNDWKDVFKKENRNLKSIFQSTGIEIFKLYGQLADLETPVEFKLTREQEDHFNSEMSRIYDVVVEGHPQFFTSNVKRHGLILFRICMIFSAFRKGNEVLANSVLACSDEDFNTALILTKQLLHHADAVSQSVTTGSLTEIEEELLFGLKESFTREEALIKAKELGMPTRTVDEKLKKWRELKFLKRVSQGRYKRILG
ncbi:DUF3987 domain-containing protein [Salinimicrobium sp. GXAS 041]|uniref:DUF3987 domain-containing protein n=1 Tax=Salinimicrobium sp. GXAS 041 TaxID=3400806 RepID=UPI003C764F31